MCENNAKSQPTYGVAMISLVCPVIACVLHHYMSSHVVCTSEYK